jgi:cytochrome c oxidase assembly protein subunit 15
VEPGEVQQAKEAFPERPVEQAKAWREMVHRYLAGALVLLVVAINVLAWRPRHRETGMRGFAAVLLGLILFQAALGMWTVTLKLLPVVVMAHLLGGLATLSLLVWLTLGTRERPAPQGSGAAYRPLKPLILLGLVVLVVQLALGGWTSANYAALACPDFPLCHGQVWPEANFRDGFTLWREIGVDYEGGVLDLRSRTAIHLTHRVGAAVVAAILGLLVLRLLSKSGSRTGGGILGILLLTQLLLGVLNVVLHLPLAIAAAHNAVGALLLAAMVWLLHQTRAKPG